MTGQGEILAIGSPRPEDVVTNLRFDLLPISYVDDLRLQSCLKATLSGDTLGKLRGSRRLRDRLSKRLRDHYRLESCNLQSLREADRRLLRSEPEEVSRILRCAGSAWIGGYLKTIVTPEALRPVLEALGREAYDFALAHPELSAGTGWEIPPGLLRQTVDWLGLRSLIAWSASVHPAPVFARIRLMLPPSEAVDRPPNAHEKMFGPRIIKRILEETFADA